MKFTETFKIRKGFYGIDGNIYVSANGRYLTVVDGEIKEGEEEMMACEVPLIPSFKDKLDEGDFYLEGGNVFFAAKDGKVICLENGQKTEVADKSHIFFGKNKVCYSLKFDMSNPMAMMMCMKDADMEDLAPIMMMAQAHKDNTQLSKMLPLMMMKGGKADGKGMMMAMMMAQLTQQKTEG